MSFDLAVLALGADNDDGSARRMYEHCIAAGTHDVGEPDRRIMAFYEQLRSIHPDQGPAVEAPDCPWNSTPLSVGIDHVIMHLGLGSRSTPAIETVLRLAAHHGLAVYDPQRDDVYRVTTQRANVRSSEIPDVPERPLCGGCSMGHELGLPPATC
ncbi:hypothetical protein [Amycolatopsis sp. NPDC059021]|uniref:hypothetical protein n=1 Tax=Amycolatopsis sp. NPDC059021 TaxID=3346704 RepID=UPI00366F5A40